jgi:hypothetical protein
MRKAKRILRAAGLLLCLSGCSHYDHSVQITDVQKEETILLKNFQNSGHVYSISIRGSDSIDGDATVSLILNGEKYKTEELTGAVRFSWGGDWYADRAEIRYEPNTVNSGELVIAYSFSTT